MQFPRFSFLKDLFCEVSRKNANLRTDRFARQTRQKGDAVGKNIIRH